MKDEHIVREFVRSYFALLTSEDFDKERFKAAMRDFFVTKHRRKFSFPSNKDCMVVLLSRLKGAIPDADISRMVQTLPFFRLTGERERDALSQSVLNGNVTSVLPQHDLDAIRQVGAFEAVAQHKGKELAQKAKKQLEHIEQQIETKQKEYEALPSILDQETVAEPEFNPEVEEIKPWWERFYLAGDPFPLRDGLSAISKDLYEQVIIKTEPFQRTLSSLQRNPDHLFHSGFLLAGDYGFGKTTFIDYLSNYLINRDILPLRITSAKPYADSAGFMDSFLHKLATNLKAEGRRMTAVIDPDLVELELEDQIIALCRRVLSARRHGIVIFMDDYHKHRDQFPQIFDFLGTLQILKNTLTREGVNVGFVVSGLPTWMDELSRNSQLLGFLDNTPIVLPSISPELVSEVFNRRIAAFCFESTPRRIRADFVRKLVKDLGGEQGIRGCITRIVAELSNNNTAIVDSPVEIDDEVLGNIRKVLDSDHIVKPALNKLRFESRFKRFSNQQIVRCLELLVHLNVQNGIAETDRQFLDNRFYFKVLRDANLIQKFRIDTGRSLQWNLQYRFGKLVQEIQKRFGLNMSDYLLKLYAFKETASDALPQATVIFGPIQDVKRIAARTDLKLERAVRADIEQGVRCLESLMSRDSARPPTEGTLNGALEALDHLSNALFQLDNSHGHFARLGISDCRLKWLLHPTLSECMAEAFQRVDHYRGQKDDLPRLSHAVKQLENALLEISETLRHLVEQICETPNSLLHRPGSHTMEELELFRKIDAAYYSGLRQDHFDYVRDLTDYLELRLRKYFYFCSTLLFGANYFDACPQSISSYAFKNLSSRANYSSLPNKFDGLTRAQFKQIFLQGNLLRDSCVKTLETGWKEEDWTTFADIFATENIKVAHQLVDTFSPTEKNRYRRYANLAEELLAAMNQAVAFTFDRSTYICIAALDSNRPSDCFFQTSFRAIQIKPEEGSGRRVFNNWPAAVKGFDHVLPDETYERVLRQLKSKLEGSSTGIIIQDLLDIDYIQTHYRVVVSEFAHTLAYAKYIAKTLIVEPWLASSIAIRFAG